VLASELALVETAADLDFKGPNKTDTNEQVDFARFKATFLMAAEAFLG
jgi:hypothetical protein